MRIQDMDLPTTTLESVEDALQHLTRMVGIQRRDGVIDISRTVLKQINEQAKRLLQKEGKYITPPTSPLTQLSKK